MWVNSGVSETREGVFWCVLGGSGCRWGVVMVEHLVYQDRWCWRAVNQERNQEQQNRHREGSKMRFS